MGAVAASLVLAIVNLVSIFFWTTPSRGLEPSHLHSRTRTTVSPQLTMSSCMLIMDDNHWLIEWLAYHWTTLNLRHLILAVDPRSQTSPVPILDRWKGRINVEIWNDSHYFHNYDPNLETLQELNLARQQTFLAKCMQKYKQRNHSWVMFTDTDEFITINPRTKQPNHDLYREYSPSLDQPGSILSFLEQEHKTRGTSCFSMGRLQFSPDESSLRRVRRNVPDFFNASQFMTLRWLHPADDLVGPKNIVHLSSIPSELIPTNYTHQHRVIGKVCGKAGYTWHRENSLLQVNHYLGTFEQFQFRNDARLSLEWAGRNERFERYLGEGDRAVDNLRPWIRTFVDSVGKQEAMRLLEGVGRTGGWESAATAPSRGLESPLLHPQRRRAVDTGRMFYSIAKTDRAGAVVVDMLLAHAYGYANNMTYAGACPVQGSLPYQEDTKLLIHAVGLQNVLKFACPKRRRDGMIVNRRAYASKNTQVITRSYLEHLRVRVTYPSTKRHIVVVHVRRGDISPCNYYANRYLPNSHYLQILSEYVPPGLPVSIFSESDSFETFDDFQNSSLYLDTDLPDAWKAMISADYIVLSKSSFSFVPALLNPSATVIYTPFMQRGLPEWKVVSDEIMDHSRERVLEMIEESCSPEEKKIVLTKLS